ncbi:MAG: hypothetical protein Q4B17_03830 [Lautropia sp.]|nr:hypothetical protein [Lautropia sp.]
MMGFKKHFPAFVFCISTAASLVLMQVMVKSSSSALSALLTYGISTVFFVCTQIKRSRVILEAMARIPSKFVAMNLASALTLVLAFESLKFVSVISYVVVFFGSMPAMSHLVQRFFFRKPGRDRSMSAYALMFASVVSALAIEIQNGSDSAYWVAAVFLVSLFAVFYMNFSHEVQVSGKMTPGDIMATRFLGTILVCVALVYLEGGGAVELSGKLFFQAALTSMTSVIIPLYFMQKSIDLIGPKATASWFPLIPVVAFGISMMSDQMDGSIAVFLMMGFFVVAMMLFFFHDRG